MNPILARFQDEPALVNETRLSWFESCVNGAHQMMSEHSEKLLAASDDFWFSADDWRSQFRPYTVKNGILHVPVKGVLLNNFPWSFGNWATGYEYIWQAVKRGVDDSEVRGIALVIDSPGGMVAGNFDLVEKIVAVRGEKQIRAYATESAYSAAYSIASAASKITVTRTGGVGSIGVVVMHADYSGALENAGIKINFIFAGKHKVDGNPYEKLPDAVRARIQERVDTFYDQFTALVAANRDMDVKAVRKTEAQTFMSHEAVENGLADEIGSFEDALLAFVADLNQEEDTQMAEKTQAEQNEAAVSAARAEGHAAGVKDGTTAAMTRINAIINSEAAKDRPKAAMNAALKTSMSVEEATAFLADLPKEAAEAPTTPATPAAGAPAGMLAAAMQNTAESKVEAGQGGDGGKTITAAEQAEKDRALAAQFGLAGFKSPAK